MHLILHRSQAAATSLVHRNSVPSTHIRCITTAIRRATATIARFIPRFLASFRRRRPSPYERNAAISRHFERDPIPYALETDWPVGAGGFEPLHVRIGIRQDSQPGRRDSNLCILDCNSPKTPSQGVRIRTSASWNRDLSSGPGPELAYLELQVRRLHSQKMSQASDRRRSPLSHDEVHQD